MVGLDDERWDLVKPLVILGTSRSDRQTRSAVSAAFPTGSIDLIDLNDRAIRDYSYTDIEIDDDFPGVIKAMSESKCIVFATPVYWYSMSAILKRFFDRLTDLLGGSGSLGRDLVGRQIWLLATGTDNELPDGFEVPFQRTADYFGMRYHGCAYLVTSNTQPLNAEQKTSMREFGENILQASATC